MYSSRTRARSVNTHIALATTHKGTTTMADYYNKIKRHADEMVASCQPLRDEEFIAYVLMGLDEEIYNPLVSSIVMHIDPISPSELFSLMLSFELRLDKQSSGSYSSANTTSCGCGTPWTRGGSSQFGRGPGHGGLHLVLMVATPTTGALLILLLTAISPVPSVRCWCSKAEGQRTPTREMNVTEKCIATQEVAITQCTRAGLFIVGGQGSYYNALNASNYLSRQ
jgi:hypothetical protein